ncbi:phosphatidylglycerophosphatase A [Leuconostoc lactis]|uniref:Phosphatidylglycerophosphatase A n=1 Tax=Leuconostoc lactis TaxID=1246 RepID=A0AAP9EC24_LEULA|nr:phosphatidylglycerophosphatase A [Leuconostoc lactis]MCC2743935.1 phosphatidylglycerophosphatase A [Leuconostoc lactis]MCC2754738.1 phosphatidylglycerophosphatase A [Leuconostoc lactis]MDI6495308.1 phosphatidylglycerophosphatase A [Leuconostoc lactis]PAV32209.1 phosphatidylglycerophosphatase A [Leuconostoc lactis]QEA43321.1 phosphatidylglycerophosphatase A [Leuconostoc lactis]
MKDLQEAAIGKLAERGVTIADITAGTQTFLTDKYHDTIDTEKLTAAVQHVLHKDEVADIILTAIYLDEQAALMPETQPLKARLQRDANGHNVDEILAIAITQQFSAAATVHYGLLDDLKPGLIGEINDRTDSINVYLDDILAALIASSAMTYLELLGGNNY